RSTLRPNLLARRGTQEKSSHNRRSDRGCVAETSRSMSKPAMACERAAAGLGDTAAVRGYGGVTHLSHGFTGAFCRNLLNGRGLCSKKQVADDMPERAVPGEGPRRDERAQVEIGSATPVPRRWPKE